ARARQHGRDRGHHSPRPHRLHRRPAMSDIDPARLIAAHREAIGFYRHHLLGSDDARRYLARRGFAVLALRDLPWHPAVNKPWQVGYAPPGWRNLTDHLTRLGHTID